MSRSEEPVNVAEHERIADAARDISYYCAEHRDVFHRCNCPFECDGVCSLHFGYPDGWPDLRGMTR